MVCRVLAMDAGLLQALVLKADATAVTGALQSFIDTFKAEDEFPAGLLPCFLSSLASHEQDIICRRWRSV